MDKYEKKAKQLETAQDQRYKNSTKKIGFFQTEFERDATEMVIRYRQLSTTYKLPK